MMSNQVSNETIVLYNGQSQYDVLKYFIFNLARSFNNMGYEVYVYVMNTGLSGSLVVSLW